MDYAVVKLAGTQYLISPGDIVNVSNLNQPEGEKIFLPVLLQNISGDVKIGSPVLESVITAQVVKNFAGDKLDVFKFKAKSRYRRKLGFRPRLTSLEILPFKTPKK